MKKVASVSPFRETEIASELGNSQRLQAQKLLANNRHNDNDDTRDETNFTSFADNFMNISQLFKVFVIVPAGK